MRQRGARIFWLVTMLCALVYPRLGAAQDADGLAPAAGEDAGSVDASEAEAPEATEGPVLEDATESRARAALVRAVGEYNAGRYQEAYALFLRAHELEPTARTLRGLGMVLFELRRYADSARRLSAALHHRVRPLTDRQREQTEALLERARAFLVRVVVHVSPRDALLTLDGVPVELIDGELDLDAGDYTLVAQCEGCRPRTAHIHALAGERTEISLVLPSTRDSSGGPPPPIGAARPNLAAPAVTLGTGVALVLASLPTGVLARSSAQKLEDECRRGVCDGYLRATRDRANRLALTTDVLWISGAVIGAVGLSWLLVRRRSASTVEVQAACAPGGCVSTLRGRF